MSQSSSALLNDIPQERYASSVCSIYLESNLLQFKLLDTFNLVCWMNERQVHVIRTQGKLSQGYTPPEHVVNDSSKEFWLEAFIDYLFRVLICIHVTLSVKQKPVVLRVSSSKVVSEVLNL